MIPCQYDGPVFHEGSSRKRARLEKHGGDIIEVEDDTTAAPGPAQSRQEADVMDVEEDEVLFREKVDDNGEDRELYEYEAEMSEEMLLEKLEKFLL